MASDVQVKVLQKLERCEGMWHGYVTSKEQLKELELDMTNVLLNFCTRILRTDSGISEYNKVHNLLCICRFASASYRAIPFVTGMNVGQLSQSHSEHMCALFPGDDTALATSHTSTKFDRLIAWTPGGSQRGRRSSATTTP